MVRIVTICGLFVTLSFCALAQPVSYPRTAIECYDLGEDFVEKQEWTKALNAFNECLHLDLAFADAYYTRGLVKEHLTQWSEALTDYSIYLDLKPDHTEAIFNRAQLRYKLHLYSLAKEDFQKLLELPVGETSTVFFRQHPFSAGVDQIFTSQGVGKTYVFNWLGLTETALQNYKLALIHFDSAIRLSPQDPDLLVNKGIALAKSNDPEKANVEYAKALRLDPYHALAKYNSTVLQKNTLSTKTDLLDSAIADNPTLPYVYAERGYERMQHGNYAGALQDYNSAIRIDPTQADYFLNRGVVKEKLQQYQGAYSDYSKALLLNEQYDMAWLTRGNLLFKQNRLQEAIDDYTAAITFHEDYAAAYYNRALVYQKLQQFALACADVQRAEKLAMKIPPALRSKLCANLP